MLWNWDYRIRKGWRPRTELQWKWFLTRKINYGDFRGLKREMVKKYLSAIRIFLDPGKRAMLDYFFGHGHSQR